ncbi:MAG: tail fiber domain-containing protein [Bacteroidota bacterium]
MKRLIISMILYGLSMGLFSQSVGINPTGANPDASAMLDVQATDKGMLLPRLTTAQRDAIPNPSQGLMIYNVNDSCFNYYSGSGWILDCGVRADTIKRTASVIGGSGTAGVTANAIEVDDSGNMYVGGQFSGTVAFGNTTLTATGTFDAFVTKISRAGEVIWVLHGSGPGLINLSDLAIDGTGNLFAAGDGTASFGTQAVSGTFVLKISSAGQVLWGTSAPVSFPRGISVDGAGDCYLNGRFSSTMDFGAPTSPLTSAGGDDLYLAKFNGQSGAVIWAIRDGGSNNDDPRAIVTDLAGNSVVCGWMLNGGTLGSVSLGPGSYVAKYDASGQFLWAFPILGSPVLAYDLSLDPLGNIHIGGRFVGSATFGSTVITASGTGIDGFVAKLDGAGTLQWAFAYGGGTGEEFFDAISTDASGNSFISGYYTTSATFGSVSLPGSGPNNEDAFVLKIDPNGLVLWAQSTAGSGDAGGNDISTDAQGNAYVTGEFSGTKVFGEGEALTSQGSEDMFTWSLSGQTGANLVFTENLSNVSLRPDNLGNHTATQNLQLSGNWLSNDGDNEGLRIESDGSVNVNTSYGLGALNIGNSVPNGVSGAYEGILFTRNLAGGYSHAAIHTIGSAGFNGSLVFSTDGNGNQGASLTRRMIIRYDGNVGIGTDNPGSKLEVVGTVSATAFVGDGSALTNLPGDNLGNHQATQNLQLSGNWLSNDGDNEGVYVDNSGNVGINANGNAPDPSAMLDVQATDKGLLIPRMTSTNRTTIASPAEGLMVFDQTTNSFWYYQQGWRELGAVNASTRIQDADGDTYVQVEGNPDEDVIRMGMKGKELITLDTTTSIFKTNLFAGRTFEASSSQVVSFFTSGLAPAGNLPSPAWQSFTAPSGGRLDFAQIVLASNPSASYTVSLYAGEGTNMNQLLSTATITSPMPESYNQVNFPDEVILNEGETYTLGFSSERVAYLTGDVYPDGTSSLGSGFDYIIRINIFKDTYTFNVVGDKVGIGTATPTNGKLVVSGGVTNTLSNYGYLISDQTNPVSWLPTSGPNLYSIYASDRIACSEFNAFSDARIKTIEGISDAATDLQTLMRIEVTDYRMKDSIAKGSDSYKKVIAQQVAEVYPHAVTTDLTEVVPDIYQRAEIQEGWIMLATDLQIGERIKLITAQSATVYEVSAVEPDRFQVLDTASRNVPLSLGQAVFVYGREVDDFHTVDYEALSMLNVSATQAQQRRIEELEAERDAQQAEVEALRAEQRSSLQTQNQTLELVKHLEARLQALEGNQVRNSAAVSPPK